MRGKATPPAAWQVVDERDVPEVILPLPVNPVRLERVPAIWDEEDDPAPVDASCRIRRRQPPTHLSQRPPIITYVLQYFVRQNEIKRAIREGQVFPCATDDPGASTF